MSNRKKGIPMSKKKKIAAKTNPLLSEKIPSNKKKGARKRVAGK
jgi:ribosomal protein S6E (S10)